MDNVENYKVLAYGSPWTKYSAINDTQDMSEDNSAIAQLIDGQGFTVLDKLVSKDKANDIREYVLAHLGDAQENAPGDLNLTNLIRGGETFRDLVTHPRLLAIAHQLLGPDCKLAAMGAKVLMPGCGEGALHVDYPYWAMDPGMPVTPALMMQVIWMMEPFSKKNGGTWIAPGSQKYQSKVDERRFAREAVQIEGLAGDAAISHGLLWHRTASNHSTKPRVALLINYSQLSIRPMRELGPFSEEFLAEASDQLKALLPINYGRSLRDRLKRLYS